MRISTSKRFLFLSNPRCGSNSIAAMLAPYSEQIAADDHLPACQASIFITALGWRWDDFYTFTTVRNPWDRMVSAYHYGRVNPGSAYRYSRDMPDFKAFLHLHLTERLAQQFNILNFVGVKDRVIVNDVLRIEDISTWAPQLAKRLALPELPIQHVNGTERKPYREYYDKEDRRKVEAMCADDIRLGGYRF